MIAQLGQTMPPSVSRAGSEHATLRVPVLTALALVLAVAPSLPNRTVNWRESDVLMVGRNDCRGMGSLLFPRIDHAGPDPRITGMELPILNHLAARVDCGGAGQVIAARLLTLAFGVLGVFAAWALARRHLSAEGARTAIVGLTFSPVYLFYSRTIQPDVPSLALGLLALALFDSAVAVGGPTRWGLYLCSAVALALGAMVKLPVLVYGLPLFSLLLARRGPGALRDARTWLYPAIALVPPLLWYSHARRLQEEFGVHYFFLGHTPSELIEAWTSAGFYWRIYGQHLFDAYAFPVLSAIAVGALFVHWRRVPAWIRALVLASVIFFFLAGRSGAWHTSYGLVAVPAIVFSAAVGVEALAGRWPSFARPIGFALVALTAVYGIWRVRGWAAPAETIAAFDAAKKQLDALVPVGPLVVVSDGDPKLFWYLDRRGVIAPYEGLERWLAAQQPEGIRAVAVDLTRLRSSPAVGVHAGLRAAGFGEVWRSPTVELWAR